MPTTMTQHELNEQVFSALSSSTLSDEDKLAALKSAIAAGAEINCRDDAGDTPLIRACRRRRLPMAVIEFMLEAGAEVSPATKGGHTALTLAICSGDFVLAGLLLHYAKGNAVFGRHAGFCLISAVRDGDVKQVERMLELDLLGCEVLTLPKCMKSEYELSVITTALYEAVVAEYLDYDMLALLLKHGADANPHTNIGFDALACVVQTALDALFGEFEKEEGLSQHDKACVELLLAHGADPYFGVRRSAVHAAVYGNNPACFELLVPEDVTMEQIHAQCGQNFFPWALRNLDNAEFVSRLIARGADVNTPDNDGKTPLCIALERAAVVNLYKGCGFRKARENRMAIVKSLLAAGAAVNLPSGGVFPMVAAERAVSPVALEKLQSFAAASCVTPLSVAVFYGDAECVDLLLAAGAEPNTSASSFAPLELASCLADESCHCLLLAHGAKAAR